MPILAVNNIETVVHNHEQLDALKRANLPSPIKVWLKIDTGMHRLGVALDEVDYFYQELKKLPQIQPHLGFVSHFSRADELESDYTQLQINRFYPPQKINKVNALSQLLAAFFSGLNLIWNVSAQALLCTAFLQLILSVKSLA